MHEGHLSINFIMDPQFFNALMDGAKTIIYDSKRLLSLVNDEQSEESVQEASTEAEQNVFSLSSMIRNTLESAPPDPAIKVHQDFLINSADGLKVTTAALISAALVIAFDRHLTILQVAVANPFDYMSSTEAEKLLQRSGRLDQDIGIGCPLAEGCSPAGTLHPLRKPLQSSTTPTLMWLEMRVMPSLPSMPCDKQRWANQKKVPTFHPHLTRQSFWLPPKKPPAPPQNS